MLIKEIEIKNFRSLKKVSMKELGKLNVLIGANSSGKTNLLEALFLFFSEMDPALERNIGTVNDEFIWFDRDSDEPIEFRISIEIDNSELEQAFSAVSELLNAISLEGKRPNVSVVRQIVGPIQGAKWKTKDVYVNNTALIKDGKLKIDTSKIGTKEIAQAPGQPKAPAKEYTGIILQAITAIFKGNFCLISAARDIPGAPSGLSPRTAFVQPPIITEIVKLGQYLPPRPQETTMVKFKENLKKIAPTLSDFTILSNQPTIREEKSDMYVPIQAMGGGHQEIISILYQIEKAPQPIIGVEEPELHSHASLSRGLFEIMKEKSDINQLFITTHSTVFVDQAELSSTWIVRKVNKETDILRIQAPEELKNLLYDLGGRPSDIFFSNAIVFVEGPSDRAFFSRVSAKMDIDFRQFNIAVIPTYGKNKGKYHMSVWVEAAKNTGIKFFMILDKGAAEEAKEHINKGYLKANDNLFLLKKGDIEDYYPDQKLVQSLEKEYNIKIPDPKVENILESPRSKKIEEFLKSENKDLTGWKERLAAGVAEITTVDDVPSEIKTILERIRTKITTS